MEITEKEFEMVRINTSNDCQNNEYCIIQKVPSVQEFIDNDCIRIIDENGVETAFTNDNFFDLFDEKGLNGFIL